LRIVSICVFMNTKGRGD